MLKKLTNYAINQFLKLVKLTSLKVNQKNMKWGEGFTCDYKTQISTYGNSLIIGKNVYLRSNPKNYHAGMPFPTTILIDKPGAQCSIGDFCRINGVYIHAQKSIKIGNNCVIASGVNIIDSNGHVLMSKNRTKGRDEPKEIVIGDNVWIGLNSIILKDTVIGDNSVVAAGSVVKGKFPSNVLIQGNPAKVISELKFE